MKSSWSFARLSSHLRNHNPAVLLKHDNMSLSGQLDNPPGSTFAQGAVAALDEFTERQRCLSCLGLHSRKIKRLNAPPLLGISPMPEFMNLGQQGCRGKWHAPYSGAGIAVITLESYGLPGGLARLSPA